VKTSTIQGIMATRREQLSEQSIATHDHMVDQAQRVRLQTRE